MNARILILEDDSALAQILSMHFEDQGHEVSHASSLADARRLVVEQQPDLMLMDQGLPDGEGFQLLTELVPQQPHCVFVMMTAQHDLELAIAAIKVGAFDFIHKPIKTEALDHTIDRALQHQQLSRQVEVLSQANTAGSDSQTCTEPRLLGQSQAMLDVSKEIALVADSQARVLVTGESGTGKELVARAIHQHSQRPGPFLAVNCAALVDNLLESELFGHEKGAFTGASNRKPGKFELASGGTLFLDEIGEMALPLQAKLLRVLQEGTFERLGGSQTLHSGARVIAATNRDLLQAASTGHFREDLYYRLSALRIHLPPLRQRAEDIPLLVEGLLQRLCRREGRSTLTASAASLQQLQGYPWPGNIRELENVLTQAVIRCRGNQLEIADLNLPHLNSDFQGAAGISNNCSSQTDDPPISLAQLEARHIQRTLNYTNGHKGNSCALLGISRPALDRKIKAYGLTVSKQP